MFNVHCNALTGNVYVQKLIIPLISRLPVLNLVLKNNIGNFEGHLITYSAFHQDLKIPIASKICYDINKPYKQPTMSINPSFLQNSAEGY